ncbi:PREDICTED: piggyBac transposable element-derived protein 4-like [Polistes canadensis]|uniref:piggyBac transposable element-derived protein 4-like n=1 Tax=Polistes canadensis TaxID=91411 RepID=UPI000718F763|nr:PREDICTED: piggyBac transposable element-derived protein 4-like [Polistes canadensis]
MSVEEYESDSSEIIFSKKWRKVIVFSSSEEEEENAEKWHDPRGDQPKLMPFTSPSGFIIENLNIRSDVAIETCYELFVPNQSFEEIAEQTNLYASQQLEDRYSQRLSKWTVTNKNEIKRFFGLILWMGLVKLPSLHLYWSHDPAYMQTFPKKIMSRNRFELLLRMIHFADNRKSNGSNRLYKIQPLIDTLEINFKKYYNPTEDICINESLIPFHGCIIFRQYLKQNRYKYGIKIFKLCCGSGYTYALHVYIGKTLKKENTMPTKIVMSLCRDIFDKGHTLYTSNWYTSIELANKLIDKNIHLVGTLHSSQWNLPQQVILKKLKQGEIIAKENKKGITILKWKDKRDILLLSTKHSSEMVNVKSRSEDKLKPQIVVAYNRGKAAVNLSDQMNAYNNPLRRSMKWYKKLAFELLLNTAILNGYILYKNITKKNISINEFRTKLAVYLTNCWDEDIPSNSIVTTFKKQQHKLEKKPGKVSKMRKYCKLCYEESAALFGREMARKSTKQVTTFCNTCKGQPFLCLPCFNKIH